MCIIFASLGDAKPTRDELETACWNNPDGYGWCVAVQVNECDPQLTLHTLRTLDMWEAIESFEDIMAKHQGGVMAWSFHARIATQGTVKLQNCHPFHAGYSGTPDAHQLQYYMSHNGMLDIRQEPGDDRTDSQAFLEDYLPFVGGLPSAPEQEHIIGKAVKGSKLVFVTNSASDPLIIINEQDGHWADGVWRSNSSYRPWAPALRSAYDTFTAPPTSKSNPNRATQSWWCENPDCEMPIGEHDDFCTVCNSCQWCSMDWRICECYTYEVDDKVTTEYESF